MNLFKSFNKSLAIDLGTSNTLVYVPEKGIVLNEASCVAIDVRNGNVIAIGNNARDMIGKTPEHITIVKPLENGTISDFDITKILVKYCIEHAIPKFSFIQPKVIITAPVSVSDIELRAIEDACIYSGAREVYIIESAISSAIGGNIDLKETNGRMLLNFGAGNVEIAIVNLNGIVISKNLKFGSESLDSDIVNFIDEKYSVKIGENTAKKIKEELSNIGEIVENNNIEISGRNAVSGMPVSINVFESDVKSAIIDRINLIIDNIRVILEKTPPELSKDILNNGIFVTGGGSLIKGFDKLISNKLGIKTVMSQRPLEDSVIGAGMVISDFKKYTNSGN